MCRSCRPPCRTKCVCVSGGPAHEKDTKKKIRGEKKPRYRRDWKHTSLALWLFLSFWNTYSWNRRGFRRFRRDHPHDTENDHEQSVLIPNIVHCLEDGSGKQLLKRAWSPRPALQSFIPHMGKLIANRRGPEVVARGRQRFAKKSNLHSREIRERKAAAVNHATSSGHGSGFQPARFRRFQFGSIGNMSHAVGTEVTCLFWVSDFTRRETKFQHLFPSALTKPLPPSPFGRQFRTFHNGSH
jgi:hypothetical protein